MKVCDVNFDSLPSRWVHDSKFSHVMIYLLEAVGVVIVSVNTTIHFLINLHMTSALDPQLFWLVFSDQMWSIWWLELVDRNVLIIGDDSITSSILISLMFLGP
jgi:hypothetical protein